VVPTATIGLGFCAVAFVTSAALAAVGVVLSALLTMIVFRAGKGQSRAEAIADARTRDSLALEASAREAMKTLTTYRSAFDDIATVAITDLAGVIIEANNAFVRTSGYSREELLGSSHRIVNSGVHPDSFWAQMWQTITAGEVWRADVCNRAKNGTLYWMDTRIGPDYQMPDMNGVALLSKVAELAPDCVRLMLTGNADLNTAIDTVNTGQVFRFFTKPCGTEAFARGVDEAMELVRLRQAERELLEGTLNRCLEVLSEVLSLSNPEAFGRAIRVRSYVSQLIALLRLPESWQVEAAAWLSQLGCVVLPGDIVARVASGEKLTEEQSEAYGRHPEIGARLLERIPRLDGVAAIVARQRSTHRQVRAEEGLSSTVRRGSQVLAACLEFDELITLGASTSDALSAMAARPGAYASELLRMMTRLKSIDEGAVARSVIVAELQEGMTLAQDIRSKNDTLIVASGQRVTRSMIERLRNYHHLRGVKEPIHVRVTQRDSESEAA
jgi:PAS domain S-box-containing protein